MRLCGGCRQLDMSDPEVADAALKIQAAMKGMLARHRITLELEADSTDRIAVEDESDLPDTDELDDRRPVTMLLEACVIAGEDIDLLIVRCDEMYCNCARGA